MPTTPAAPSAGPLNAFTQVGAGPWQVGYFAHRTTLGRNALLMRSGASIAVVPTRGCRDLYLLGRSDRAELRYLGQEHLVALGPLVDPKQVSRLALAFHDAHRLRYGHSLADPVDVVPLRTRAVGLAQRPELPALASRRGGRPPALAQRQVHRGATGSFAYPVYLHDEFRGGDRIAGPPVMSERTSTTILHHGDAATVGRLGQLRTAVGD